MKTLIRFFYSFVLLFSFSIQSYSQNVFPLQIGNEWHYTIYYHFHNPPLPPSPFMFKITGDTLMPNEKQFFIIEPYDMFFEKYIRSDSQYIYYWTDEEEKKIFNFHAPFGWVDTIFWRGYFNTTASGLYEGTVFNKNTRLNELRLGGLLFADIFISDYFGYIGFIDRQDRSLWSRNWHLDGCIINDTIYGTTSVNIEEELPEDFILSQNYPNPFNPTTRIEFILPSSDFVRVEIYNTLGEVVETLIKAELSPGKYSVDWNAANQPSGIYFYQLKAGSFTKTMKCILMK
jgi:hypothetical protein